MKTVIVEARPSDATGQPVDIRLAGGGRGHYLFKDQSDWRAGVISLPRIQSALGFGKDGFTGGAVAQASAIGFSPAMASTRALIAGLIWNDAAITVSVADDEAADPSFAVRLAGTVAGYSVSAGRFVFTLSDMAGRLGEPLVKASFAGTGGIEGDAAAKGRVKRRSWGRCWNVEGRVLLAAWNIYEFGDPSRPLSAFDAVKDKGRPVAMTLVAWAGSVAATLDALKTAVAPDGGCVVAPSIACVKFWTQPSTLTADLRGELGAGYVEHVPGIAAAISAAAEGPDLDGLAALAALRPDPAGLHADDASETPAQMLDRLTLRASLSWGVTADRRIALRPIAFADPVETVAFEDVERRAAYAPVAGVKIGWQKNHRLHTDAEISAAVLAGNVVYPDGKTVADLQPAQKGADVTGENTAKDTKAVGGRPVQKVIADLDAVNKDLSDALTRFDGFADDLSAATADLEGVFQSVALLSPAVFDVAQMLATSNAYLRARTTIDGMPIGSVVVETREKTDTMVEDMRLLGTRSLNGGAFQLDLSRVMVDGRTSLSQRLRQIEAKGEGDLNARATDLISTIVENGKATATRFSTLEATAKGVSAKMSTLEEVTASANKATAKRLDAIDLALDTPGTGVKASIKDLTEATLTGDGAIIKRVGVIESSLNTAGTGVWARIGKAEQTIIAQDKAFAESIETINAAIYSPQGGLSAQVAFLRTATVDAQKGVEAKAVLALNANGHVAGLVATNTGKVSKVTFTFDQSQWAKPDGTLLFRIGSVEAGEDPNAVYAPSLVVDTIKVGSVGTDALAVNAIRKVYAVELGSNPALPGTSGQRINYLTLYVKKSLAESALRISYNMRPRPGRDYAAQFVLGRMPVGSDEKTDMDVQWFWGASAVINGFRSLRQPMNLSRTFDGIPAGEHLIIVDVIAYGGGNDQGFMEAGSNLYVEEVKR